MLFFEHFYNLIEIPVFIFTMPESISIEALKQYLLNFIIFYVPFITSI